MSTEQTTAAGGFSHTLTRTLDARMLLDSLATFVRQRRDSANGGLLRTRQVR